MNLIALLPLAERLLASGQLDAVLGPQAGLLKGLATGQADPKMRAVQALLALAEVAPAEAPKGLAFAEAASEILRALAKLKATME